MGSARQKRGISVQITEDFKSIDVHQARLKKLVKAVCGRFKLSKATINIAIVDNAQIRRMNKQFLNKDKPTDCLSFNLSENTGRVKMFELIINAEIAVKEADRRGHSGEAELALYITHGLLHNLGFDDSTKEKAQEMHGIEDEILQQLGYGPVYDAKCGG